MGKTEKSAESIAIIGGSDGPTAVFFGSKKTNLTVRQKLQKYFYEQRKKRMIRRIKPGIHTMEEVVCLLREQYGFSEVSKDTKEYREAYDSMRFSSLMQFEPQLLGDYAAPPSLESADEEGFLKLQEQWKIRHQKAREIPEEEFAIELYLLQKEKNGNRMHFELEARFGHIGGGFSGLGKGGRRKFEKLFRAVYAYYGVTQEDIEGNTRRYQELVRALTMRH